jgi:glucose/mannose-6-phosphate isomerase
MVSLKKLQILFDKENMFRQIFHFPEQVGAAIEIGLNFSPSRTNDRFHNILILGMGGSAIGGDLVKDYLQRIIKVPVEVCRDYQVPFWVNHSTLVVASSYSGNTEEKLSAVKESLKRGAFVTGVTSGGALAGILKEKGKNFITIPGGLQPRAALGYSFFGLLFLIAKYFELHVIQDQVLSEVSKNLTVDRDKYVQLESAENLAVKLANSLQGTFPLIYSTRLLHSVGFRWRSQFAENAKMLSSHHEIPEMNHNEIVGWDVNPDFLGQVTLLWLADCDDHPRIKRRVEYVRNLFKPLAKNSWFLEMKGKYFLTRMFRLIYLGDFVSYYLALINHRDPTPVEKINGLKEYLKKIPETS